jgi:hypothetical protein
MGWGAQSWVRGTPELTYGVFDTTNITPTWFRLVGDTAFSGMPEPQRKELMSADGGNRPVQNISSRVKAGGKLRTPFYPTQAAALLAFATALTSNDLTSWTFDHFDSFEAVRYLGAKVETLSLSCAATTDEGILMADFGLIFQKPDTVAPTLAQPAFTVFPTENPYVHKESKTGFTVGGSARSRYNNFKWDLKNILAQPFDEDQYISALSYCGRTNDFSSNFNYSAATDRTAYEAQTASTCSILFTKVSPAHTLKLDFSASGRITKRSRTTPLGDLSRQEFNFRSFFDGTALTDFISTVT